LSTPTESKPQGPLGRWPVTIELPVQWGEMDALGHVNNLSYLRWCESSRIAYFEAGGLWARKAENIGPILARTQLDYRLALTFPDTVYASTTVLKIGRTSITTGMRLKSQKSGEAIVAEGEAVLVMVHYGTGQKFEIDEALRQRIFALEAGAR
jgi:acyl-CoA thioester hydrolase